MPRQRRCAPGGFVYHALNRAVGCLHQKLQLQSRVGLVVHAVRWLLAARATLCA
jgi:hypothetical protein